MVDKKILKLNIKWQPPPNDWHKLNTDGAAKNNSGVAGIGGIIRNHKGDMVAGFTKNIGCASNNKVKVWAFRFGLKLALDLDIDNLISDGDHRSIDL